MPVLYNAVFNIKCKAFPGIRLYSMHLYYGALQLIIVLTYSFYKVHYT